VSQAESVDAHMLAVPTDDWSAHRGPPPLKTISHWEGPDMPDEDGLTKDQIRQAPDFEAGLERDEVYRNGVGDYYSPYLG
jgi:hypothetical protein